MRLRASLPRNLGIIGFGPIEFSRDSRFLLSISSLAFDKFNLVGEEWERASLSVRQSNAAIHSYATAPDGRSGLLATGTGTFLLRRNKTPVKLAWPEAAAPVYAVAISPDGKLMAGGHRLAVWTTRAEDNCLVPSQRLWNGNSALDPPAVLRFSPNGTRLAVGYFTGRVEVKEARTGETLWVTKAPTPFSTKGLSYFPRDPLGKAANVTWFGHPGGERFFFPMIFLSEERLAYSNGRATFVCAARTGKPFHVLPRARVYALAAFSGGKTLVVAGCAKQCEIELWDVRTGQIQGVLPHSRRALCLAVSPDQKYIAALEDVNGLKLWTMN